MRKKLVRLAVICLLLMVSCSKGGGDNADSPTAATTDTTTITDTITKTISFTPSGTPTDNSVYLEEDSISKNTITLAIKIKGGSDVYGAVMEITYEGAKISYLFDSENNYLGNDGTDTDFIAQLYQSTQGLLLIGTNRKGNVPGVDGDGMLGTITFKAIADQTNTPIEFNITNSVLNSSTGNISGTSWFGGSLSYQ